MGQHWVTSVEYSGQCIRNKAGADKPAVAATDAIYDYIKQEAQLPQRNSASAAHTCAADALFLCGSSIGIGRS